MAWIAAMEIARAPRDMARARPRGSRRRVHRLGRYWAIAVNQKLVDALGLAALAWAAIAGIAWALIAA
ncbi:MAG TPA: hypothetical protein VMB81_16575 [Candidatus Sulfotelmatobacter sp.]|nr:hypothetical protein [Candidatus Sulfotelmatobacter sp.]